MASKGRLTWVLKVSVGGPLVHRIVFVGESVLVPVSVQALRGI